MNLKVGDRIVENGRVCEVFKIKKEETPEGEETEIIYYKPCFEDPSCDSLICSVPVEFLEEAGIRNVGEKNEMEKAINTLSKSMKEGMKVKVSEMKDLLKDNTPKSAAEVLRLLWIDKKDENTSFSLSKKSVFTKAMKNVVQEFAVVKNISVEEAQVKIEEKLTLAIDS